MSGEEGAFREYPEWLVNRDPVLPSAGRNPLYQLFLMRRKEYTQPRLTIAAFPISVIRLVLVLGVLALTVAGFVAGLGCLALFLPALAIPYIRQFGRRWKRVHPGLPPTVGGVFSGHGVAVQAATDLYLAGVLRGDQVLEAIYSEQRWTRLALAFLFWLLLFAHMPFTYMALGKAEGGFDIVSLAAFLCLTWQALWLVYLVGCMMDLEGLKELVRHWEGRGNMGASLVLTLWFVVAFVLYALAIAGLVAVSTGDFGIGLRMMVLWGAVWLLRTFNQFFLDHLTDVAQTTFMEGLGTFEQHVLPSVLNDTDAWRYHENARALDSWNERDAGRPAAPHH